MKVIDFKRFADIVGSVKLNSLIEFDGAQPVSSDFHLLHCIFKELNDDKHVPGNCEDLENGSLIEHDETSMDNTDLSYSEVVRFFYYFLRSRLILTMCLNFSCVIRMCMISMKLWRLTSFKIW